MWKKVFLAVVLLAATCLLLMFCLIHWRLPTNVAITRGLADRLHVLYPEATFRVAASSEQERLILTVVGIEDAERQEAIKSWLAKEKETQALDVQVWLIFPSADSVWLKSYEL